MEWTCAVSRVQWKPKDLLHNSQFAQIIQTNMTKDERNGKAVWILGVASYAQGLEPVVVVTSRAFTV